MLEGLLSPTHLLFFAFIALLIFGRRLPEIGRSMGKGITEFKKGLRESTDEANTGVAQDPYQQNAQQIGPARAQSQQSQPYQQQSYQQPQRLPVQPVGAGQPQVRVTRNDMVD